MKIYQPFPQFPLGAVVQCCPTHFAAREKLSQPLDSEVNLQPLEEGSALGTVAWRLAGFHKCGYRGTPK